MFGVALFAAGLTVLLVMWPMLRPARPATEAWTVDEATGAWTVEEADPSADRWPGGRRPAPRHRRGGRRRAGRAGLPRRRVPVGAAPTASVPRQRRGGRGADVTPRPGVVGTVGTPPECAVPKGVLSEGALPESQPVGPPPATVPVIGTTVAGTPYRGVAPVPDGSRRFP